MHVGYSSRRLMLSGALLASLVAGSTGLRSAHAQVGTCRTDPVLWLSNGAKLQVIATLSSDPTNVQTVTYTVHVPSGVTVDRVQYTGSPFARSQEILVTKSDAHPGQYDTHTVARANSGQFGVTADVSATLANNAGSASGSISGNTGNDLHLLLQP